MKKEELIALGITEEQAAKVLEINGKDIEHAKSVKDTEISKLTTERDDLKGRLTTAEDTLKKFGDKTPEQIQQEIQTYQDQAKNAQADFDKKILQRDQKDWLKAKLDEYGVTSPFARNALVSEAMSEDSGLKWKDNAFFGFDDFMKSAKEKDKGLYQTAEEKEAAEKAAALEKGAARFTGSAGDGGKGKGEKYTPPKIF